MANLNEVAEAAWLQLFPNPTDETAVPKEVFIVAAKTHLAYKLWEQSKLEKSTEGVYNIPSYLLEERELEVVDNKIDVSKINVLRSLSDDMWLQNVGGIDCKCNYVRSSINMAQLMCGDDSLGDGVRTYYPLGGKIIFPKGTHLKKLPIVYAKLPEDIQDNIDIDDALGDAIGNFLVARFGGKVGVQDGTNNSNSNK